MKKTEAIRILSLGLAPHELRIHEGIVERLASNFESWFQDAPRNDNPQEMLSLWLIQEVQHGLHRLEDLRRGKASFSRELGLAADEQEMQVVLLEHARQLGATPQTLKKDRAAFQRWFGPDAVYDRYVRRECLIQRDTVFLLGRLGVVVGLLFENIEDANLAWQRLEAETLLRGLLAFEGDSRVRVAAFKALAAMLRVLPEGIGEQMIQGSTLQFIYQAAQDKRQDVWIQNAALSLLQTIVPDTFQTLVNKRLSEASEGDDIFVRHHIFLQLAECSSLGVEPSLLQLGRNDSSPYVRQAVSVCCVKHAQAIPEAAKVLIAMADQDQAPEVKGKAIVAGLELIGSKKGMEILLEMIGTVLRNESDPFVLKVACHCLAVGIPGLAEKDESALNRWISQGNEVLNQFRSRGVEVPLLRMAMEIKCVLWSESNETLRTLKTGLHAVIETVRRGRSRRLPRNLTKGHSPETLGRMLAVLCRKDFGFDLEPCWGGYRITRDYIYGFRFWRFLHEFMNPSPDKRQAFSHTRGRKPFGRYRVPTPILAELSQTTVPGEPLYLPEEDGWRPYLPLVDDAIASLELGSHQDLLIFTCEGITELTTPGLLGRIRAWFSLTFGFETLAALRNWREGEPRPPSSYIQSLRGLGFGVKFMPWGEESLEQEQTDSKVQRFFTFSPAAFLPWDRFWQYFFSIYENTPLHLVIFASVFLLFFVFLHYSRNRRMKKSRSAVPLVVGGWGTRGKSGTERLKAGVFSALGYGYVGKTSGCEAMFLHTFPFGEVRELFLFRPYDKATIWEQEHILGIAAADGADVFLWECMGLTPEYVAILQRSWMKDDISTITNTYPDHEDLQGPAGINIPEVMTCFIPRDSVLVTSEEQMCPILSEAASQLRTQVYGVGWLEAGLLTKDILKRFPYEEHPLNIALVLELCRTMQIDPMFSLKSMADYVVPDLGVLKTFPPAPVRGRFLQFTNGMSANERLGCLGNWTRLGFDQLTIQSEPATWITTVINNRADRIPRSRIFARIIAQDIAVDRHVLIGNNLDGMRGYIDEEWSARMAHFVLWNGEDEGNDKALVLLEKLGAFLRVCLSEDDYRQRMAAFAGDEKCSAVMNSDDPLSTLEEAGDISQLEEYLVFARECTKSYSEYSALRDRVAAATKAERNDLQEEVKNACAEWFAVKFVEVEDYFATGDEVIEKIVSSTPPHLTSQVMGMQNIKGTGLDFVYRWQNWDACYQACRNLMSTDRHTARRGLDEILAQPEIGILCRDHIGGTLSASEGGEFAQDPVVHGEFERLRGQLEKVDGDASDQGSQNTKERGWLSRLLEELLDGFDAISRRRKADQIYRDLLDERIGRERAVKELKALVKRQKGGWFEYF